jgi:glycosyltransferase involved in cell wall biosynthesis
MTQLPTVAQICLTRSWGGLDMNSVRYTRYFRDDGYQSYCFCLENTPIHNQLKKDGLNGIPLKGREYLSPGLTRRLRQEIREKHIQAIYCHHLKDLWLIWPALWGMPEVKLIGFARMFLKDTNKNDFGHKLVYGRLNKLIALSSIQKSYLLNCLPVPDGKYTVIPNGVDTVKYQPRPADMKIRRELGAKGDEILVALVGRFDPMKGQLETIKAAKIVLEKYEKVHFALVGDDTANEASIRPLMAELKKQLGVGDKVSFHQARTDMPQVMNAIDIFLLPSYEENFSNVLLEAMASGVACIGTDSGGTPEIIEHEVSGLLVKPEDEKSLAAAILRLLEDPDLRRRLGAGARRKAETTFDLKKVFQSAAALVGSR